MGQSACVGSASILLNVVCAASDHRRGQRTGGSPPKQCQLSCDETAREIATASPPASFLAWQSSGAPRTSAPGKRDRQLARLILRTASPVNRRNVAKAQARQERRQAPKHSPARAGRRHRVRGKGTAGSRPSGRSLSGWLSGKPRATGSTHNRQFDRPRVGPSPGHRAHRRTDLTSWKINPLSSANNERPHSRVFPTATGNAIVARVARFGGTAPLGLGESARAVCGRSSHSARCAWSPFRSCGPRRPERRSDRPRQPRPASISTAMLSPRWMPSTP